MDDIINLKNFNGFIVIDKPEGITSARAVAGVRKFFHGRKVGHGGTLDPLATGILPMAIGTATKALGMIMDHTKIYRFSIRWGEQRDTDDREGIIIATSSYYPSREDIIKVLPEFIGEIQQKPPVYSALKVNGQRAYALARQKKVVDLPFRQVTIHDLQLISMNNEGGACFEVTCGKGTYVRSLARDLALCLKTVGYVSALRRMAVGPFHEKHAFPLHIFNLDNNQRFFTERLDDIPAPVLKRISSH